MGRDAVLAVARDYVHHLVLRDYLYEGGLGTLGEGARYEADDVECFISEYRATIIDPPEHAFELRQPYAPEIDRQGVSVRLWTEEEGESNIRLDLEITQSTPHQILEMMIEGCPPFLIPPIQEVVHHLVTRTYTELEEHGHIRTFKLSPLNAEAIILEYRDRAWEHRASRVGPREEYALVDLPASAFKNVHVRHVTDTTGTWVADIALWWAGDGGPGDLTLRLEIDVSHDAIDVQVVGLEVM